MSWHPYTDQKNRAYSSILTTLFPEQTKSLPSILIWSVIFLADLIVGIFGAVHFGLLQPAQFNSQNQLLLAGSLVLLAILAVFWVQGFLWGTIVKFFRRRHELD